MKKSFLALPVLAIAFAFASCGGSNSQASPKEEKKTDIDYSVTAFTPKGDTAWVAVTDDMIYENSDGGYIQNNDGHNMRGCLNILSRAGLHVTDKKTGQDFYATPGTVVVIKSIPSIK